MKIRTFYQTVWLGGLITPLFGINAQTLTNLETVGKGAGYQDSDIKIVIASVIQALLGFIGMIFFILILWGGFEWMTSGGNEQKIESAKKRIVNASIGLALVLMAYAIARTISSWLTEAVGTDGSGSNYTTSG